MRCENGKLFLLNSLDDPARAVTQPCLSKKPLGKTDKDTSVFIEEGDRLKVAPYSNFIINVSDKRY